MALLNNSRLAWSVALASLALWATSVPMTWGQLSADANRMLDVPPLPLPLHFHFHFHFHFHI